MCSCRILIFCVFTWYDFMERWGKSEFIQAQPWSFHLRLKAGPIIQSDVWLFRDDLMFNSRRQACSMWCHRADIWLLFQVESNDLMRQAQVFLYANGNDQSPTAIDFDKSLLRDLLFNQSPAKVLCVMLTAESKMILLVADTDGSSLIFLCLI